MRFFFFSSRRRHTRYWRDWSSDVCSSDLRGSTVLAGTLPVHAAGRRGGEQPACDVRRRAQQAMFDETEKNFAEPELALLNKTEKRRVGKEGRFRWSPDL